MKDTVAIERGVKRDSLSASEAERYRAFFERSFDCFFLMRLDGVIADANQAALDLVGLQRRDIGTVSFRDFVVPEQLDRATADILRVIEIGTQEALHEYSLYHRDGRRIDVESRLVLVYAHGVPCGVQGIARDITARKQQEAALRESELRFRKMAETIREVFWLAPPDHSSILYVSPAFEHIWGRPPADLYAHPHLWLDAVHAEDRPFVVRSLEALGEGQPYDIEFRIILPDSTVRWINDRAYAVRDEIGLVTLTAGVANDVTERRRVDEQLRLAATVFEHSREGILIADAENRIVSTNRAFTQITGYDEAEVVGRTPTLLQSGRQDTTFYDALWQSLTEHGHWAGEVWNRRKTGEVYPEWLAITDVRNPTGAITHRVSIFTDISERKEAEERLRHLVQFDRLTDLPNRTLMADRVRVALAQARRRRTNLALLFLDLDRFKLINDSLGHELGDQLLEAVSQRLRSVVRESDSLSRHGGNEFVILLTQIKEHEDAGRVAHALIEAVSAPYRISKHELVVTASVGIAVYPDNGTDLTMLLRNADAAMYAARKSGRGRYQFFSEDMNQRAAERLALEQDLRQALKRGELFLVYQPQVALSTGEIIGVEALTRWRHPVRGVLSPSQFIPAAEESGLIVDIGDWALRAACEQIADWRTRHISIGPVAVNISATQFRQPNFAADLQRTVEAAAVAVDDLELEVTESVLMDGAEAVVGQLDALRRSGFHLAIDDFGTGYSSLSYLRQLPIHRLKIDKSFVEDLPDSADSAAVTSAIVHMGHALRLSVIGEGVETSRQANYLCDIGCDDAQGYLYCQPLSAEQLEGWLHECWVLRRR